MTAKNPEDRHVDRRAAAEALAPFDEVRAAPASSNDATRPGRVATASSSPTNAECQRADPGVQAKEATAAPNRAPEAPDDARRAASEARRSTRTMWIAAGVLGGTGLLALIVSASLGPASEPIVDVGPATGDAVDDAPPAAVDTVRVSIEARPMSASLYVDGERVDNPYDVIVEPSDAERVVEARLDGYVTQTRTLRFDADLARSFELEPEIDEASPATVARSRPTSTIVPIVEQAPPADPATTGSPDPEPPTDEPAPNGLERIDPLGDWQRQRSGTD